MLLKLKYVWPGDISQLHAGGWEMTHKMEEEIENLKIQNPKIVDLCCGEGATSIYLSKKHDWNLIGIDKDQNAIKMAKMKSIIDDSPNTTFITGCTSDIPIKDNYIDVVIGQDPDSFFDHNVRYSTFKEVHRILKPDGIFTFIHHWIPGYDWDYVTLCEYFGNNPISCARMYLQDLKATGFEVVSVDDISELSKSHLTEQYKKAQEKEELDDWLYNIYDFIQKGHKFGLKVICKKILE